MEIRLGNEKDFLQLAEMKWSHSEEDDADYGERNLDNVNKDNFVSDFTNFLKSDSNYRIFVAEEDNVILSAMFVCLIPKIPKPNGNAKHIAYLTNVYTKKEFRGKNVGTKLLNHIKQRLIEEKCELIFAWPSEKSVNWYEKNGFYQENEIFQCDLTGE